MTPLTAQKRTDYLSWDDFFLSVAHVCAMRSKDPNTQVGSCVVNQIGQIIATGYNGLPRGLNDNEFPWAREGEYLETKYPYVAHAELNAILSAHTNLENCRIYTTLFPCAECAKIIIQVGIKEVIYDDDKYVGTDDNKAAKRMFDQAQVSYRSLPVISITVTCQPK
ncbi:MAG: dCMP deaminase family protein [Spiroplasma poulsonii]|uniref:tRNA-specific adenosine deaminase n=1 Tax=Spiroplasma poulsonii TaxID=2138 RepID=A0A2P6FCC1_9MOLU|nr:dCMP deaminase family protein [Spiroplasma poulsonii]KAF0851524.1 tRNA-specific adenosine deaminase [Spiroplasma poulsonii]MBW1241587.1 dCMP deaminase family protein [Spiroplasma poulsonii]PQM31118.1 tRNA-specific adenosine deaminase [Spiroplasma poulsonii]PWF96117.1 tRNA-specific adenosine deaminase [Spiroplasma poulsonii]PWF98891.1 tRNA-specific adenosine deaminase [Spiroplasma poulsonii]